MRAAHHGSISTRLVPWCPPYGGDWNDKATELTMGYHRAIFSEPYLSLEISKAFLEVDTRTPSLRSIIVNRRNEPKVPCTKSMHYYDVVTFVRVKSWLPTHFRIFLHQLHVRSTWKLAIILFTIDMEVSAFLSDGGTSKSSSRHEVMIQVTPGHGGSFSHSPQVLSNLPWPKTCHLPRIGRGLLWPVNNRGFQTWTSLTH